MSSPAAPARPIAAAPRPAHAPSGAGSGPATIDPVKIVKQYKWWLVGSLVVGAVIGLAAHFILNATYPLYRSTVIYAGLPPVQDLVKESAFVDREEFERMMLTQAFTMSSDRILREAIRSSGATLAKDTAWAKAYLDDTGRIRESDAVRSLRKMVSSNVKTGTQLIELSVTTGRREDAPVIVNAVHAAFWADLAAQGNRAAGGALDPLSKKLQEDRLELERLDTRMETIRREKGVTDPLVRETREATEIRALEQPINEASGRLETAKATLKNLEDMIKNDTVTISEELKDLVERDPVVNDFKSRIASINAEIASMKLRGLGPEHKARSEMEKRLETTTLELDRQRDTLSKKLFAAEVDRQRRLVTSAEAELREYTSRKEAAGKRLLELTQALATLDALTAERAKIADRIEKTKADIDTINLTQALSKSDRIGRLRRLEEGRPPDSPFFPQLTIMIPLGVIAALGLTGGFIFLRELFDQRVKGPSDIAMMPRMRLIGIVPLAAEDPSRPSQVETAFRDAPTGAVSEGFRQIRAPIAKRMNQAGYKSLLVVGGMPESGVTSVVSNLAMGAAASDLKVLMVDANFRRPALHRVFKLGEGPGLGDVLARKVTLEAAVQATSTPNLHLLAAGTGATRTLPERLGTDAMAQLLKEAAEKYDVIFIDTAPAVVAGDAQALANRADAVVLVAKANTDKRGMIARVRDQLSDCHAEFLGVVVNGVKSSAGGYMRKNLKAAQEYQSATPTA